MALHFRQQLSKVATNDGHGENSPYFDGWKAYDSDPYHPTENPLGVIQMGLAENQVINLLNEVKCFCVIIYNIKTKIVYCFVFNLFFPLQLCFDLIQEWLVNNPRASICTTEGINDFKEIAIFQDYHGLPEFRDVWLPF